MKKKSNWETRKRRIFLNELNKILHKTVTREIDNNHFVLLLPKEIVETIMYIDNLDVGYTGYYLGKKFNTY